MQDLINSKSNAEIDLRELFMTLWAYKLFIASICLLSLWCSVYYIKNVDKEYSSTAIFKLDQEAPGISPSGELSTFINLAGFNNGTLTSTLPTDEVTGRIFIENLDTRLNFKADPYFNTYNPNLTDPIWKSLIKRAIGWQKSTPDVQEAIWQSIVKNYIENVVLDQTLDGSVKVIVTHVNAPRAAKIANVIMDEIISSTENKKTTAQEQQMSYLSNTLAKALSDLEVSQSSLKEFAMENSALPLENFTVASLKLDALREQLNRTSELHEAVAALSLMLQNKTTDQNNYLALRQQFPIIDQVEFRRVLGQNEIISSWNWPEASSVDAVFDTLSERKSRLQSEINVSQINTERSALALETYAKLEREAKVAQATYTVLIEQVKAQSVIAGYQPDKSEIYEYASTTINPSKPNRNLILALGAILGLFLGTTLSLILAYCSGVYYSKNSLRAGAQARLSASIRALMPLRNRSLIDVNTMLVKKPRPVLGDIALEIHKSGINQVVVTSSRSKLSANNVACALASYMQSDTLKIAVIDFSKNGKKLSDNSVSDYIGSFVVAASEGHVSILRPEADLTAIKLISQKGFLKKIQSLNSNFNLIFLCADNTDAISLIRALEGQKMFHLTLARTKHTKSDTLLKMRSLLPIQGLLHD